MREIIENKIIEYLREYKKLEGNNELEFAGPSVISMGISDDETTVYETCSKLQKEGKITTGTVCSTRYGNLFGYRIKD